MPRRPNRISDFSEPPRRARLRSCHSRRCGNRGSRTRPAGPQLFLFGVDAADHFPQSLAVEIHVGDGGEKPGEHCLIRAFRSFLAAPVKRAQGRSRPPSAHPEVLRHRRSFRRLLLFPYTPCTLRSAHTENKTFRSLIKSSLIFIL